MYHLMAPDAGKYQDWAVCLTEFNGGPIDGSGFEQAPEPSVDAFTAYLHDRSQAADTSTVLPEGWVHCNFYWIGDETGSLLGFLAIRHALTPHLLEVGGHIGYSVRPSARSMGVATAALRLGLEEAGRLGIDPVLLTVKEENLASRRVIERCGGRYEDSRRSFRRYWF